MPVREPGRFDRRVAGYELLLERFIGLFKAPQRQLILDFDATDDPVHGEQAGRFFHGFYRRYCFLPLYVFCGDWLLVSNLRRSNSMGPFTCYRKYRYGWYNAREAIGSSDQSSGNEFKYNVFRFFSSTSSSVSPNSIL